MVEQLRSFFSKHNNVIGFFEPLRNVLICARTFVHLLLQEDAKKRVKWNF